MESRLMKRLMIVLAAGALMGSVVGCGYDGKQHATKMEAESKHAGKAKPEYIEFTKDGRIYVVASKASADKVQAGGKLSLHKTAIGYGPNKETVVFEASKDGIEELLQMEYAKRHPGAKF
jgi:hypothetical protein